MMNPFEIPIEQ